VKRILFRVDGGSARDIGTGHIARSLLIAGALRDRYSIVFASLDRREYDYGHARITSHGYPLHRLPGGRYPEALQTLVDDLKPHLIVCDLYEYGDEELRILKGTGAPLMTFDHFDAGRGYSDFPINAVSDQAEHRFAGPDYAVVPPPKVGEFRDIPENIFVCVGGFDAFDLTSRLTRVVAALDIPQQVHVVVSDIYPRVEALKALARQARTRIAVHQQPDDFAQLLADSDIAFLAGGLTLFQALSCGVSVLVINQYDHQVHTVNDFAHYDAYVNLGKAELVDDARIATALTQLIDRPVARRKLRENARRLVDGRGLERIVQLVGRSLG
jgi:spore coat polysaccharide biosynthesis predicted glycosyltransferase SpsG